MLNKLECIQLLKQDVIPALGCTEPVCVALCLAHASKVLDEEILSIECDVNIGIFKNGMSAGIPNFEDVGLKYAATLGAFLKNPEKGLKLFEDIDDEIKNKVYKFKDTQIHVDSSQTGLFVKGTIHTQNQTSTCIIKDEHTNVIYLSKNNENTLNTQSSLIQSLKQMKISDIVDLVNELDVDDIEFLYDGVKMNLELADYAKDHNLPLSSSFSSNLISILTSAIEARLSGCPLSTMSSSGAGTKGIALILPIHIVAEEEHIAKEKELKALALGHLLNRYINSYISKLSPMCTCVMASSTACSAALVYMFGGNKDQIGYTIKNMTGTVTGMICDGGKVGCSLKVSTGTVAALICAKAALNNAPVKDSDGIVASSPEKCIQNMAYLSKHGMKDVDTTIVEIMKK
ncbi:serine dehydratase subunit alpha family protein [uncultured Holdemanella sp.]|uniref:L-cysteine desulfidase family protein n=1 Tax=uncultured Holdemanella sp. TaxID=1763549 RepID=UPI0025E4FCD5|nr:L-serine ammonia-lyase, iron-sulfur-dependent, subunit alpha [uncultured Holdemanella sp.]